MQPSHDAPSYVRKHAPQISISDDNHHVTEAIGGMYGSDDDDYLTPSNRNSRPLSFVGSAIEAYQLAPSYLDTKRSSPPRSPLQQTGSNEKLPSSDSVTRKGSLGSENLPLDPSSPPPLSRKSSSSAETAVQQFPLNDIDYESSPAAVAQELNNLQAIRRMSMSVDNADPDLPSFGSPGSPGSTSPEAADEDEASRLFWVPARLHPELAPKEFKTFVEDRVDRIRKRSGSGDSLMPGVERSNSASSLTRKKSMLSRQIDSPKGYEDGAERLQRKRSESGQPPTSPTAENLQELEGLVSNASLDSARNSLDSAVQMDDAPILPAPGPALKRSTRTYMRKDRTPFSRRALSRQSDHSKQSESDGEGGRAPSPSLSIREPSSPGITRVQTEPAFARDAAPGADRLTSASSEDAINHKPKPSPAKDAAATPQGSAAPVTTFHSRIATNGRTTAQIPGASSPIPQIVETPPAANTFTVPERKSSHIPPSAPQSSQQHSTPPSHGPSQQHAPPRARSSARGAHSRPALVHSASSRSNTNKSTLEDISSNPSPLPGSGNTRTDALTMVPMYEEKKVEKKDSRKTSWNWLLGSEEKDKEKERKTEDKEREKEASKKSKAAAKHQPKPAEKTRLDVLQSSIDGNPTVPKGRESLVLDRESFKLEEERKKESSRRSADGKKDKDSGILSAIFGGGKRSKEQKQHHQAPKETLRAPSPEPGPRTLRPDIDYNWTRFSILEERAIYRMAHMKLANPRRPLHSQVLLSNFMYSYLAKVQMYHPQSQTPVAQKTAQARQQQQMQQQQQQQQQQQHQQDAADAEAEEKQAQEYKKYQSLQEQRKSGDQSSVSAVQQPLVQETPSNASGQKDYLGYSADSQPFGDQSSLWQDEENSELW